MADLTIVVAFLAGIASFLSPCVLPLIPGFLSYLSGTVGDTPDRRKMFLSSVFYVLGFSVVFALLGVLLNSILASAGYAVQAWLSRLAGLVIIVFGLHLTGLVKLPFLYAEHKPQARRFGSIYLTSFVFGAAFAVGWTPCVGPILGSVIAIASTQPGSALVLLLSYSFGLGVPFLIVGAFSSQALALIKRSSGFLRWFNLIVGILLIVIGVLVFTQTLSLIASFGFVNEVIL